MNDRKIYTDIGTKNNIKDYIKLGIKGFCMGASDVIPGVSGGTMAFILGIYEELIKAIRSFDAKFIRLLISFRIKEAFEHTKWKFVLPIFIGILTAVFTLARLLAWLLQNKPILIWSFFFGLILASVYTISRDIKRWSLGTFLITVIGAMSTYLLVGMVPAHTPNTYWFLFLSGAIAICAMILPGISGAFILVLLGKYDYVLSAVNNRDFITLFLVAMGAVTGLVTFVRLLNWLFNKYRDLTIAMLMGLMVGSLRKIWPWKQTLENVSRDTAASVAQINILPSHINTEVILAFCLSLIGFLIVITLNSLAINKTAKIKSEVFHG